MIKSIKWSITACDVFLVLGHLNELTTDNFKLKCPIKQVGMETADSDSRFSIWTGGRGPLEFSMVFFSLFIEMSEELSYGRRVMCSALCQSWKGDTTFGDRRGAGRAILSSS